MAAPLTAEQLALIERVHLDEGTHANFEAGVCAMELVSYLAGEPFSDHPQCVCPVLGAFVRSWNDALPDDERDALLKPLLPRLIGTRASVTPCRSVKRGIARHIGSNRRPVLLERTLPCLDG